MLPQKCINFTITSFINFHFIYIYWTGKIDAFYSESYMSSLILPQSPENFCFVFVEPKTTIN